MIEPIQETSKGSDQTAPMRRLILAFDGGAYHIVGNLMSWLICHLSCEMVIIAKEHLICMQVKLIDVRLPKPLYLDGFSLTVRYNKDWLVQFMFQGVTGRNFQIIMYYSPWK